MSAAPAGSLEAFSDASGLAALDATRRGERGSKHSANPIRNHCTKVDTGAGEIVPGQIKEALIKPVLYQGTTLVVPQPPQNQRGL